MNFFELCWKMYTYGIRLNIQKIYSNDPEEEPWEIQLVFENIRATRVGGGMITQLLSTLNKEIGDIEFFINEKGYLVMVVEYEE